MKITVPVDLSNAGFATEERVEGVGRADSERRDHADASDHHPPGRHHGGEPGGLSNTHSGSFNFIRRFICAHIAHENIARTGVEYFQRSFHSN